MRQTLLIPIHVKTLDDKIGLSPYGKTVHLYFSAKVPLPFLRPRPTLPTHDYNAPNPGAQWVVFEALIQANTSRSFGGCFGNLRMNTTVSPRLEWLIKRIEWKKCSSRPLWATLTQLLGAFARKWKLRSKIGNTPWSALISFLT